MVKKCVIVVCSAIDCTLDDRRFYDVVVSVHGNPTLGRKAVDSNNNSNNNKSIRHIYLDFYTLKSHTKKEKNEDICYLLRQLCSL